MQVTFDSFSSSAPGLSCLGSTNERRVCLVSWALALGAVASVMFRLWQLPLPILFFTPFASLVFLINFGFVGVGGGFGSGLDSERAFTFGSFSLLSIRLGLVAFCPSG